MLAQDLEVAHAVPWKRERAELHPALGGEAHALRQLGLRGLTGAARVVKDRVRERMAADFLLDLAGDNAVEEALPIEDRVALLRARWVRLEPAVPRRHDLRVLAPVARGAALEEEVTERAPGRGDLELCEQREQAVDHECVLALAGLAVGLDAAVERSPDQFEVEAEREDAAVERRHRTALTRNMLLSSRSTGWSARRSSSGSQP